MSCERVAFELKMAQHQVELRMALEQHKTTLNQTNTTKSSIRNLYGSVVQESAAHPLPPWCPLVGCGEMAWHVGAPWYEC